MHLDPPPIPLIKINHDNKLDKDFVKLKLCRNLTSAMPDLYEFKMALFDNGDLEELLFFVCNLNMNLVASGMMGMDTKVKYIPTLH